MIPKTPPLKEMRFAAKTGFMSRSIWEEYFSKRSRTQNLRVWRSFVSDKYFTRHSSERLDDILILSERSRKLIENAGGEVVSPPHINQIDHDEIVSRILLVLTSLEIIGAVQTEGELRRKYMGWIKKTKEGREAKLPDLLIEVKRPDRTLKIALEIELSRKNPERYRKVMNSYAAQKTAERVIFISDKDNIFDRLSKAMKDTHYPSWEKPIGYSRLKEWMENPLTAAIAWCRKN